MDGAGIMDLPTNVGGATSQNGLDSFAPLIAAQQAARDIGYPRFTRELMAAGSEMDPAEVQEFLQSIRDAGLTAEDVALMRRVVEAVFNDPNNYPEVRERLLGEGVPDDLLPETFDIEFFTALRLAVEEAENLSREPGTMAQGPAQEGAAPEGMAVAEMAEGGIVGLPELTPVARELASMGRNGDTMLAHITPQEAMMLKRMGGSGTINPYTGLPEFFLGKLVKGIGKAIKGVAKGIKKFAKSTVGRMITAVALGAFLGPAAAGFMGVSSAAGVAAVSGAMGGFGSSILAGDGLKGALRNGLTGAVLAGGMAGITGGSAAFQARPELQAAYQQQGFLGTVRQTAQNYFGSPVDTAKQMYGTEAAPKIAPSVSDVAAQPPQVTEAFPSTGAQPGGFSDFTQTAQPPAAQGVGSLAGEPQFQFGTQAPTGAAGVSVPTTLDAPFYPGDPTVVSQGAAQTTAAAPAGAATTAPAAAPAGPTMFERATAFYEDPSLKSFGNIFYDASAKSTLGRIAPALTTAGIGYLASGEPFKVPETGPTKTNEQLQAEQEAAGLAYLRANPQFAGTFVPSYYSQPTYRAARGSGPQGVENFPRKNGHISGPGTGTSDDIPAMLSDGEFVFTAKAVRNMGGGSRRKGAAKMYKLMKMLEGGPVGKTAKA